MSSPHLKREISGIALMLFAVFLAGALAVLGVAQLRSGVDVRENVGPVGYYLAYPPYRPRTARVAAFEEWIAGEAQAAEAA